MTYLNCNIYLRNVYLDCSVFSNIYIYAIINRLKVILRIATPSLVEFVSRGVNQ